MPRQAKINNRSNEYALEYCATKKQRERGKKRKRIMIIDLKSEYLKMIQTITERHTNGRKRKVKEISKKSKVRMCQRKR